MLRNDFSWLSFLSSRFIALSGKHFIFRNVYFHSPISNFVTYYFYISERFEVASCTAQCSVMLKLYSVIAYVVCYTYMNIKFQMKSDLCMLLKSCSFTSYGLTFYNANEIWQRTL